MLAPAVSAILAIAIGAGVGVALAPVVVPLIRPGVHVGPTGKALRADLAAAPTSDGLAQFYRERGFRPLWVEASRLRPQAEQLLAVLRGAGRDDLSPQTYHPQRLALALARARSGQPAALARAELMLSGALAAYARDLHRAPAGARLAFVDPAVAVAPTGVRAVLEAAARAPSLADALASVQRVNPIYAELRADLAAARAAPHPNAREITLLRINLQRARALPPDLGPRYILVNPAAEKLWLYQNGQAIDRMKVIVGKTSEPTPAMIGLIRYADLNPYWEVPPDLAREIAAKVAAQGLQVLARQHLQVLTGWTADAATLDPQTVDWTAVADGRQIVRLRQLPGPGNMMGRLKFMLPNPLGVYLHDTPMKGFFADRRRTDSAGCVRLADAAELGQRLFGHPLAADPNGGPDQRLDLPRPTPVYILYLTARPTAAGAIAFAPDIYGRDPALLKRLG
ncbi:MAG TPA: L,D-transpeptidase family protein [Caulobacteraceae bacterium]|nr:L,D-transpeptidase family protein [Caulobacteraceae bacterium]